MGNPAPDSHSPHRPFSLSGSHRIKRIKISFFTLSISPQVPLTTPCLPCLLHTTHLSSVHPHFHLTVAADALPTYLALFDPMADWATYLAYIACDAMLCDVSFH